MSNVYAWRFRVRTYELGARSQVKLNVYQNYMEEAAVQASGSHGYDWAWYHANGCFWVARAITLRYGAPALYPDELEMQTWVSDFRRVSSNREFVLRRVKDEALVLRARTNWVYLDMHTMRPQRIPEAFRAAFDPTGAVEPLEVEIEDGQTPDAPLTYAETRAVARYELDSAGHVNNAVYTGWIEQTIEDGLRAAGWGVDQRDAEGVRLVPLGRKIEYLRSAQDADALRLTMRVAQVGASRVRFRTEISDAARGDVFTVDETVKECVGQDGPVALPAALCGVLTGQSV
ncbi:MAG: thioesterase family protein [Anaerolineae bacterium]|nr:thioesterase family protein [Anaerolineae bacterium]